MLNIFVSYDRKAMSTYQKVWMFCNIYPKI